MTRRTVPYGSWESPITSLMLTESGLSMYQVRVSGGEVYWIEDRPMEQGRSVIVRRTADGRIEQITPEGFSARTRAHEYGGGAYTVHQATVFFSNDADQRLYRQDPGRTPEALTPEPGLARGLRYADACVCADGEHLVGVRETHYEDREAVHELVVLPTDGSRPPRTVVSGSDFYSSPCVSPDGRTLAWLSWTHPRMPWDGTELWMAEWSPAGQVSDPVRVAGGDEESVFQPAFSPEGILHFVSDRSGWWNLYALSAGAVRSLAPAEAEFGCPQWVFGQSRFTFLSGGRIACVYTRDGVEHLGVLHPGAGEVEPVALPYTSFGRGGELRSDGEGTLFFVGASPSAASSVVSLRVSDSSPEVIQSSAHVAVDPGYFSEPRAIEFPTEGGLTAHALFYPPANKDFQGPRGMRPPLLVVGHGGPTSQTTSELKLSTQFWTSRGFAVVDVNYSGSTGYGREYRERLRQRWGVLDTADCVAAARYLAQSNEVDGRRMAIRGASAGGYTALCALVFHDVFAAGASFYGVADVEALAENTHKFESRYLDSLIGPYPETKARYRERSPIHFADRLSCPVILFQGSEDKIVPPTQAEVFVEALEAKGLPYAYLLFEGEAHGFRRGETIREAYESELSFYAQLFSFEPADDIPQVHIQNQPPGN